MSNLFHSNIRLANDAVTPETSIKEIEKNPKKKSSVKSESTELKVTDKVKIYTGVVPNLEDGKDKLKEILEQDYDSKVRETLNGFIQQLEQMQIAMLDFAKVAIQSQKMESASSVVDSAIPSVSDKEVLPAQVKITAGMINGTEPIAANK